MKEHIKKLFKTRDKAVKEQNAELFRSTQLPEVEYSSAQSYLAIDSLKSEVLFIHKDLANVALVLVKETYKPKDKPAYSSYMLYFAVNTEKGWFIYKIR